MNRHTYPWTSLSLCTSGPKNAAAKLEGRSSKSCVIIILISLQGLRLNSPPVEGSWVCWLTADFQPSSLGRMLKKKKHTICEIRMGGSKTWFQLNSIMWSWTCTVLRGNTEKHQITLHDRRWIKQPPLCWDDLKLTLIHFSLDNLSDIKGVSCKILQGF